VNSQTQNPPCISASAGFGFDFVNEGFFRRLPYLKGLQLFEGKLPIFCNQATTYRSKFI
jgi:hypothetical protein